IASHLVFPLAFLLPLYRPTFLYHLKLRIGMQLYDALSLDKSLPRRQHLDRADTLAAEPTLEPDGLAGAWRFYDAQVPLVERLVRLTKGVHLVTRGAVQQAHVLFAKSDGRLFFVVPWRDATIVGTTDTDYDGDPGQVAATEEDVRYLQEEARHAFPSAPFDEIYFTW